MAVFDQNFIRSFQRSIWYSTTEHAVWFYLGNRTTAHREYLMGSTFNNLVKFWVCKLFCLKRRPSIEKAKYWNIAQFCRKKRNSGCSDTTPSDGRDKYWMRNDPNSRLSMESNCRPQLGLFKLNQLKIWRNFKYINSLLGKRHMIRYFRKSMSNIPGDNGSSLKKLIAKIFDVLANITITKTSVSVV
jgi:hypothetical protein